MPIFYGHNINITCQFIDSLKPFYCLSLIEQPNVNTEDAVLSTLAVGKSTRGADQGGQGECRRIACGGRGGGQGGPIDKEPRISLRKTLGRVYFIIKFCWKT